MNWILTAGPSLITPSKGICPPRPESKSTTEPASSPLHNTSLQGQKECKGENMSRTWGIHNHYAPKEWHCYLSVGPKASLSRWRCNLWSLGASRDQEQERSWVALGPWCGEGDSTLPTVAFFTVPPQRAAVDS